MKLNEYEESLLRFVQSDTPTTDQIFDEFVDSIDHDDVEDLIEALLARKYIRKESRLAFEFDFGGEVKSSNSNIDVFVLTQLGKTYLANSTSNYTSISNINNSNISNHSPHSKQLLNINEFPEEIQELIKDLKIAADAKDGIGLKKVFGYIADKSVDAAIALAMGSIRLN